MQTYCLPGKCRANNEMQLLRSKDEVIDKLKKENSDRIVAFKRYHMAKVLYMTVECIILIHITFVGPTRVYASRTRHVNGTT